MPVNGRALLEAAVMLAEVEEMRVTVKNTFTASAVTALAGTSGFLLLGPAGLFIGSTVAGLGAYSYTKNKFKPVYVILKDDLRPQQQQELIDLLRKAFEEWHPTDAMKIFALIMNHQELWVTMRTILMTYMAEYFMTELSVKNVNVEVKEMTDLEKYRKFTEEFKRQHGITGMTLPPAIEAAVDSKTSGGSPAPGWRPELAATSTDGASASAFPTEPAASAFPPTPAKPTAPALLPHTGDEASASIVQLNIPAHSACADDCQSLEEGYACLPPPPPGPL